MNNITSRDKSQYNVCLCQLRWIAFEEIKPLVTDERGAGWGGLGLARAADNHNLIIWEIHLPIELLHNVVQEHKCLSVVEHTFPWAHSRPPSEMRQEPAHFLQTFVGGENFKEGAITQLRSQSNARLFLSLASVRTIASRQK